MRRILLALALLLLPSLAQAQCIGAGSTLNVPQPGVNCNSEPTIASYAATGIGIAPAASATDIACIQGSATAVIRVQSIRVSGTAGTSIIVPVVIAKRASLNTGGTPATGTALPAAAKLDSNNGTAGASFNAWTANPTIVDSSPGLIGAANLVLTKTDLTGGAAAVETLFDWSRAVFHQKPILRAAAQNICVNLNATSPSSGLVNVTFTWTEAAQ